MYLHLDLYLQVVAAQRVVRLTQHHHNRQVTVALITAQRMLTVQMLLKLIQQMEQQLVQQMVQQLTMPMLTQHLILLVAGNMRRVCQEMQITHIYLTQTERVR